GHPTVTTSRVSDLLSGGKTDMQFRYIAYDVGIPEDVFTERSLRNPPREWLQHKAN
ncbi:MAG: outer membrane lipoprotein-sorting protein, partial [Gammaproteobacteria bacterium]|nr:outer membrane lipoprotein-sorting protein [Gammaproteobacteria bacterium]